MKVCIGGTFNILHKGHKMLITRAFDEAGSDGSVFIGLSRGELLKEKKQVKSYKERGKNLENYIKKSGFSNDFKIMPIKDKFGPTLEGDFDIIVVSPETEKNAQEINEKRIEKGKKPLEIIKIPFVLAKDNAPINSTRILNKEIDKNGHVL